ncbi:nicotinate mononucleotide-dependent phosphoribosyltransferase CobT [Natrialbaceae archaeon AArc-T1-2]|uniref:nicotinate mononucleotide-dependent phosphoribosyltransferase CobT n=1 Tax=Natrialbaceae archaeon AArc-T1-2 TaxID=3053904 RepID=UPI00255ACB47|nr:TIGR00303 family protein [Natrialbaceae archaeon AArc-T1-2]WIV65837.1 TIGR00303 family protein [Natrialbaceae archaeon AArc-T1-2]
MRVILAAGTTETALIDGISAAGAAPELMAHTPSADAEIVAYGEPTAAPVTPVSPTGCPTPAAITRAVREVVDFEWTVLDAGLAEPTAAPTVDLGAEPGSDVREAEAVPDAGAIFDRAHDFGASLPDEEVLIGETIPGGTTTALGAFTALGEPFGVSSSLPANPLEQKRAVVDEALAASDLAPGDCAGEPLAAIRAVGDPVQAAVAGVAAGALETGTSVRLGGGTQLVAVAALLRHADVSASLELATTSFVADDPGADLETAAERLDLDLVATDPGFDGADHVAMERYCAGEAKEGVAMGGALSLASDGELAAVRDRLEAVCDRLGIDADDGLAGGPDDGA